MLEIKDLEVAIQGKTILKGFNLSVQKGEVHAIMGPNGAGKSTLAKVLAGDPAYEILGGEILFEGKDLSELEPEERSHLGLFMSFQYPLEIPGVSNEQFLRAIHAAKCKAAGKPPASDEVFEALLEEKMALVGVRAEFKERDLNEGFSGGEKKRNEILQMALLEPKLAILDETDSGLDIDAMRLIAQGVNTLMNAGNALILITHYQRLLDYIRPDFIHVVVGGRIVESGGAELALQLEKKGYESWVSHG